MKKIASMVLAGSLIFTTSAFAFSDVNEDYWAYKKIEDMYQSNVISGFPDGTFKPESFVTREQAAAIMTNFFDLVLKENEKTFEDIPSGYWSEQYAKLIAQYMPIVENENKYYFNPQDKATRIEIAETIVKIIGFDDEEVDNEIIATFNDKDNFSDSDKKYISIVAKNGIMVGDNNSNFRPNDTITRAEFCALIYNIYEKRGELKSQNTNKVVMIVNGQEVPYSELDLYFKVQKKSYEAMFGGAEIWNTEIDGASFYDLVKDAVKDSVIANTIKIQKAKELGIELDEDVVNKAKEYLTTQEAKDICAYYNITTDELLKINLDGTLLETLGEKLYPKDDEKYMDLDTEVERTYYDARHILLVTEGKTEEEKTGVKETAEKLLERLLNGEDFATLAGEYSEDPGSKDNGGLYENVKIGEFVPEFEEAALACEVGNIYPELVESSYGYHIIKLENREVVKEALTEDEKIQLTNEYLNEVSAKWIEEAKVEVNEDVYKAL